MSVLKYYNTLTSTWEPASLGDQGATGATGPQGATGAGVDGATGSTGVAGADGATGSTGPAGTNGTDGATGATGPQGDPGTPGIAGDTGSTGATGPAGTNGTDGATGATGTAGVDGATGATGVAGVDGATGATGVAGVDGATGATGATGPVAGSNTQVIFNDAGVAGASANLTFDKTTNLLTVNGNISGNTAGFAIGYRDIPQLSFTGDSTLALTDAGKHYYSTLATANTLTIPLNSSVAFNIGAAINIYNQGSANILVNATSGVTLYIAGNSTAGNRTVTSYGVATLTKVATDTWFIVGAGVQ